MKKNQTIRYSIQFEISDSIRLGTIAGNKFLIQLLEVNFVALADDV